MCVSWVYTWVCIHACIHRGQKRLSGGPPLSITLHLFLLGKVSPWTWGHAYSWLSWKLANPDNLSVSINPWRQHYRDSQLIMLGLESEIWSSWLQSPCSWMLGHRSSSLSSLTYSIALVLVDLFLLPPLGFLAFTLERPINRLWTRISFTLWQPGHALTHIWVWTVQDVLILDPSCS